MILSKNKYVVMLAWYELWTLAIFLCILEEAHALHNLGLIHTCNMLDFVYHFKFVHWTIQNHDTIHNYDIFWLHLCAKHGCMQHSCIVDLSHSHAMFHDLHYILLLWTSCFLSLINEFRHCYCLSISLHSNQMREIETNQHSIYCAWGRGCQV